MEALDKGNRGIVEGAVGRRAVNWGYCRGKGQEAEGVRPGGQRSWWLELAGK